MEVIKFADYVVDPGPEIAKGGTIVAKGTPEQVSKNRASYTDKFLLEELKV
jgi:excinuclease ABC subunit A